MVYSKSITIASGDTLADIIAVVEARGAKIEQACFYVRQYDKYDCNCHFGYGEDACELSYTEPEAEEDWEVRLASYRKRLASWEQWAEENKELIENHLAAKTAEKEAKLTRLVDRSHKALEREKKTLEKRLKSLEKRLQK